MNIEAHSNGTSRRNILELTGGGVAAATILATSSAPAFAANSGSRDKIPFDRLTSFFNQRLVRG